VLIESNSQVILDMIHSCCTNISYLDLQVILADIIYILKKPPTINYIILTATRIKYRPYCTSSLIYFFQLNSDEILFFFVRLSHLQIFLWCEFHQFRYLMYFYKTELRASRHHNHISTHRHPHPILCL
jgi:hypothetical protein